MAGMVPPASDRESSGSRSEPYPGGFGDRSAFFLEFRLLLTLIFSGPFVVVAEVISEAEVILGEEVEATFEEAEAEGEVEDEAKSCKNS